MQIIRAVYEENQKRHIIVKARRLGMSTLIDLMLFDAVFFTSNLQASIVDLTQRDASEKLGSKCKFALQRLPHWVHRGVKPEKDNDGELRFPWNSTIYAGLNARGGTNHWLHISEWGPIAFEDARRSEEIKTGALPSADSGHILIETTWKGGPGGHLYELVKGAMETPEADRTDRDFRFWFFPWFDDPTLSIEGNYGQISEETRRYFQDLSMRLRRSFADGQQLWWQKTAQQQGIWMGREYPSTVEEAFRAPLEGAIYADQIQRARAEGRIGPLAWDRSRPVYTSWDLGAPENTVVWYFQLIGTEVHMIDVDMELALDTGARVAHMAGKGYNYAVHLLPHDAGATERSGRTFRAALADAGLKNLVVCARPIGSTEVWAGINELRQIMPRMRYNGDKCARGIEALENYHARKDERKGMVTDQPVHDWCSHAADALRVMAEAMAQGHIESRLIPKPHLRPRVRMGLSRLHG